MTEMISKSQKFLKINIYYHTFDASIEEEWPLITNFDENYFCYLRM